MGITLVNAADRREVRDFLDLPFQLYRNVPQWVPPLAGDARLMLDCRRHPFYRHSAAAFFLARAGGQAIGRLAALDNANYNVFNNERTAFFYLFECADDPATAEALFAAACAWARDRG